MVHRLHTSLKAAPQDGLAPENVKGVVLRIEVSNRCAHGTFLVGYILWRFETDVLMELFVEYHKLMELFVEYLLIYMIIFFLAYR